MHLSSRLDNLLANHHRTGATTMRTGCAVLLARYLAVTTGIALATEQYRTVDDTFEGDDQITFTWSEHKWNIGQDCQGKQTRFCTDEQ